MFAHCLQLPAVEHQNHIGVQNSGQAVSNDERSPVLDQGIRCLGNEAFAFGIKMARGA